MPYPVKPDVQAKRIAQTMLHLGIQPSDLYKTHSLIMLLICRVANYESMRMEDWEALERFRSFLAR